MKKIVVLSKQNPVNYNQFIHWNSKGSDQSDCGKDRMQRLWWFFMADQEGVQDKRFYRIIGRRRK
jgi:hypothetical protein